MHEANDGVDRGLRWVLVVFATVSTVATAVCGLLGVAILLTPITDSADGEDIGRGFALVAIVPLGVLAAAAALGTGVACLSYGDRIRRVGFVAVPTASAALVGALLLFG